MYQIKLLPILKKLCHNVEDHVRKRNAKNRAAMLVFKCKMLWKAKIRKQGPSILIRKTNILRNVITINNLVIEKPIRKLAVEYLCPWLAQRTYLLIFIDKARALYKSVSYMQVRIKDQLTVRFSKMFILENLWNKTFGKIQTQATVLHDVALKKVLKQIVMIPPAIKNAMLMAYINKCRELYQIAFF